MLQGIGVREFFLLYSYFTNQSNNFILNLIYTFLYIYYMEDLTVNSGK